MTTVTDDRPPAPQFVKASPLLFARQLAEAEMKGTARPAEIIWLNQARNLVLWLRALNCIKTDVGRHMARDRADLARDQAVPPPGQTPSQQQLDILAEHARRRAARVHFLAVVQDRIEQVKAKLGTAPAYGWITTGDLVDIFAHLSTLADAGDLEAVSDKAVYWAEKFGQQLMNDDVHADTSGLDP